MTISGAHSLSPGRHSLSPGRIVHWRAGRQQRTCFAAVLEAGWPVDDGFMATLVVLTTGVLPASSLLAVLRDRRALISDRDSWHWPDECPFAWPETD